MSKYILAVILIFSYSCQSKRTGVIVKKYSNGNVFSEMPYIIRNHDTIYEGEFKSYFLDGSTEQKVNYSNGLKSGEQIVFDSNGSTLARVMFAKNKKHGYSYFFSDTGTTINLYKSDFLIMVKTLYPNSKLKSFCVFINDTSKTNDFKISYLVNYDTATKIVQEWGKLNPTDTLLP